MRRQTLEEVVLRAIPEDVVERVKGRRGWANAGVLAALNMVREPVLRTKQARQGNEHSASPIEEAACEIHFNTFTRPGLGQTKTEIFTLESYFS